MKYKIVKGRSITELETDIEYWLDMGWSLQGGVAVTYDATSARTMYFQAITLTETLSWRNVDGS